MTFEDRLTTFKENAWPAMVEQLADELDVTVDSMRRLDIGFAPIVQFDKGRGSNWWTMPERTATGDVCGISLRPAFGNAKVKPMLPGSKHGLFYECAGRAYKNGPDNWVRCHEAGIECPVCHHSLSDGCMVAASDPSDPPAALCIRTPSPTEVGMGYLHILKPEGKVSSSPLPPSEDPVLIVEGWSDTAAALDLGFVGVGRPSATAGWDQVALLVGSRPVIVVGENDAAGERGANKGLKAIPHAQVVYPPPDIKDLREWKKAGVTRSDIVTEAKTNPQSRLQPEILPDDYPVTISDAWLDTNYNGEECLEIRWCQGDWYAYSKEEWGTVEGAALESDLYRFLRGKCFETKKGMAKVNATTALVNGVTKAMIERTYTETMPCWLDSVPGPDIEEVLVFQNGFLTVDQLIENDLTLQPLTPTLFTTNVLPYEFIPNASSDVWESFLDSVFGNDTESIALLQEWFGYCMIPNTVMEKFMLFVGPRRAGKGVTTRALELLLGDHNTVARKLPDFGSQFGLDGMVGKLLCVVHEAISTKRMDTHGALSTLLSVIGNDEIPIHRKYRDTLTTQLQTRIVMTANDLPDIPDPQQALASRMLVLEFPQSFVGKEDKFLKRKLKKEVTGIAAWAAKGLVRLFEQEDFTVPRCHNRLIKEFINRSIPVVTFLEDCCKVGAGYSATRDQLWAAWVSWCRSNGHQQGSWSLFHRGLLEHCQSIDEQTVKINGEMKTTFRRVGLTETWQVRSA